MTWPKILQSTLLKCLSGGATTWVSSVLLMIMLLDALKNLSEQTPAFVYSEKKIREQITHLRLLRAVSTMIYAVKANANPDVLKVHKLIETNRWIDSSGYFFRRFWV